MGNSSTTSEQFLTHKLKSALWIASPAEDAKLLRSRDCIQAGVIEGAKAAGVACVASAVPTLVAVRKFAWAKTHINYTGQALIISAAALSAYFITADKAILACARKNSQYRETMKLV